MNILEQIPFHPHQAVVFDIDDTLVDADTGRIMPKTFSLYQYCLARGYHVYIITARARTYDAVLYTVNQLKSLGINGYKLIAFRQPDDWDIPTYKLNARRAIPQQVVMSVGDQDWDVGRYGGVGVIVRK